MLLSLTPQRSNGNLPLEHYAAVGDGRSVALIGADGSIDWWCAPQMDSPPLFDRLLSPQDGGRFALCPVGAFSIERRYRKDSNVVETIFITESGRARVTESMNSGVAGRLPWCELARRIEGLEGEVEFRIELRPTAAGRRLRHVDHPNASLRHVGDLATTFCHDDGVEILHCDDDATLARLKTAPGSHGCIALLVGDRAPLAIPKLAAIDGRIELTDRDWKNWTGQLTYDGAFAEDLKRCALSLKFLLYAPTGAIAAAATAGLPERLGGGKNYDYRYAWVRDAAYTIKALLRAGALEEPIAAFGWLVRTLLADGDQPRVVYSLRGDAVPDERLVDVPGYRDSGPVLAGNSAKDQVQLSCYGDVLETAQLFAKMGHVLDPTTSGLLIDLANQCCERWRLADSSIWELKDRQHYTFSKIGCWLALDRAIGLVEAGHIEADTDRWRRERVLIRDWIDAHCWSDAKQAYTLHAGSERLDAALLLTTRFGFEHDDRLLRTRRAIERELADGPLVYRYSGMQGEEGAFVACSCWLVEAYAFLGDVAGARERLDSLLKCLGNNFGLLSEQIDPKTGHALGNLPQGLSHLALLHAIYSIEENS